MLRIGVRERKRSRSNGIPRQQRREAGHKNAETWLARGMMLFERGMGSCPMTATRAWILVFPPAGHALACGVRLDAQHHQRSSHPVASRCVQFPDSPAVGFCQCDLPFRCSAASKRGGIRHCLFGTVSTAARRFPALTYLFSHLPPPGRSKIQYIFRAVQDDRPRAHA